MLVGYARVSTNDQSVNLQVDALKQAGCTKVHTETASGATAARPALDRVLEGPGPGDVLLIWKLDRLGRSLKHLIEIVADLVGSGIGLAPGSSSARVWRKPETHYKKRIWPTRTFDRPPEM